MDEPQKRPSAAFWATIVVVVAAVYVASFGPVCWIASRTGGGYCPTISAIYWPVVFTWFKSPAIIHYPFWSYLTWGRDVSDKPIVLRVAGMQKGF
jgi:hypothetical protein